MDYEKLLIILGAFTFLAFMFPGLMTAVGAIDPGEPLLGIFQWIPYALVGSFIVVCAIWGIEEH